MTTNHFPSGVTATSDICTKLVPGAPATGTTTLELVVSGLKLSVFTPGTTATPASVPTNAVFPSVATEYACSDGSMRVLVTRFGVLARPTKNDRVPFCGDALVPVISAP